MDNIKGKVSNYWTQSVIDFSLVRRNEMHDGTGKYWIDIIKKYFGYRYWERFFCNTDFKRGA